jgi:hypothetical protein
MAIGAIFYPTKRIEEKLKIRHEEETKSLKEQHSKEVEKIQDLYVETARSYREYHDESESKISTLKTEVRTLKSKQKTAYYKLIKPDGTIEIKKFSETEVDESTKVVTQIQEEFKRKIDSIEQKWTDIHKSRVSEIKKEFTLKEEQYKHRIDELEKSKVTEINKKSFGVEAGVLLNKNYYGHVTYDILGPIFLGIHGELGVSPTAGAGLGLRF